MPLKAERATERTDPPRSHPEPKPRDFAAKREVIQTACGRVVVREYLDGYHRYQLWEPLIGASTYGTHVERGGRTWGLARTRRPAVALPRAELARSIALMEHELRERRRAWTEEGARSSSASPVTRSRGRSAPGRLVRLAGNPLARALGAGESAVPDALTLNLRARAGLARAGLAEQLLAIDETVTQHRPRQLDGEEPDQARHWVAAGFDDDAVVAWLEAGVPWAAIARQLRDAGVDPREVAGQFEPGVTLGLAFARDEVTLAEVLRLVAGEEGGR